MNTDTFSPRKPQGGLADMNNSRAILDAVGQEPLSAIAASLLDLWGTSCAIHEKNGDYALDRVSSGWCRLLAQASRTRCHESCWTDASKVAIETGQPLETSCRGGIRIYAAPILAEGLVIGAISLGCGEPPKDSDRLGEIAELFGLGLDQLVAEANAHPSCPPPLMQAAQSSLAASARLLGALASREQAGATQGNISRELQRIADGLPAYVAYFSAADLRCRFVNKQFENGFDIPRERIIGRHIGDLIGESAYLFALPHIDQARAGRAVSHENSLELPRGKRRARINYVPDIKNDGTVKGIAVLGFDITANGRAEEETGNSAERNRRWGDSAPAAIGEAEGSRLSDFISLSNAKALIFDDMED